MNKTQISHNHYEHRMVFGNVISIHKSSYLISKKQREACLSKHNAPKHTTMLRFKRLIKGFLLKAKWDSIQIIFVRL